MAHCHILLAHNNSYNERGLKMRYQASRCMWVTGVNSPAHINTLSIIVADRTGRRGRDGLLVEWTQIKASCFPRRQRPQVSLFVLFDFIPCCPDSLMKDSRILDRDSGQACLIPGLEPGQPSLPQSQLKSLQVDFPSPDLLSCHCPRANTEENRFFRVSLHYRVKISKQGEMNT